LTRDPGLANKNMKYKIDNIDNHKTNNGWICGYFMEDEILKNGDLEIKYETYLPGHTAPKHSHPKSKMVIIVLSGKIKMEFNGDGIILSDKDFVFLEEGAAEKVVEVYEPTTVLCVRTPSVSNNKLDLE
jgi:quercetin dioxygenase-like cupin family protein